MSWSKISRVIGISRSALRQRRLELGLTNDRYDDITDEELDRVLLRYLSDQPAIGESMIAGHLVDQGIHVQRWRWRASVGRVNGAASGLRRALQVTRVPYSVPGPLSLVHIDGHLKLKRWGFVIHGGIDGYSRMIFYLRCCNFNTAGAVLNCFMEGCEEHGVPSRVRSDRGRENYLVRDYMLEARGHRRGSILMGRSVHNQRIERYLLFSNFLGSG
jgi:hypothetical protein